jgi:UDP-N-acetylmuramoyl-tripeptide--D-alanyl-D-alanine ligase
MIPMTLAEVAAATGGRLAAVTDDAVLVDGPVTTDSRDAGPGGLFVARVGEHADGHDFVAAARRAGAVGALVEREVAGAPCVVVEDTEIAFGRLARAVVDRAERLQVVGITGSSGKTSTKDLLGAVLATSGPTVAPHGSYNSEVGVPLTVCRVDPDTRYLVAEMGARGVGHIAHLTTIAPPRIGVVLNVGSAHLGEFGSREAIGRAKSELVAALPETGVAVLNADDDIVRGMAGATSARVILVGEATDAQVRAVAVDLDDAGRARFTMHTPSGTTAVRLGLAGRHHVGNVLSTVAVALELGISLESACATVQSATPLSRWRMEIAERVDGVTIINDAYNANPESMCAAFGALERIGAGRRTWAVLGVMLELGAESDALHAQAGADVVRRGIDELLVVGDAARAFASGAERAAGESTHPTRVRVVADADAAEAILREELASGDVALFKSSRDAGLRWLGDRLSGRAEEST